MAWRERENVPSYISATIAIAKDEKHPNNAPSAA